jgi:hypothetical protein
MHLRSPFVFTYLVAGVLASTHNLTGSFSDFKAQTLMPGTRTVGNLYNSCKEYDHDGELVSKDRVCIAALLREMFEVLSAAADEVKPVILAHNETIFNRSLPLEGRFAIDTATVSSQSAVLPAPSSPSSTGTTTVSSLQSVSPETYNTKLKRGNHLANSILLRNINDRLSRQLGGQHKIRAVDVGESDFHPRDGVAIRTNIHSDDTVLHVHTNGSHASAEFKRDFASQMTRRDVPMAHSFRFAINVFGFKMQVYKIGRDDVSLSDMHAYWSAYGYGDGVINTNPPLNQSDSHHFLVCDKEKRQLLAGKVIALETPSGSNYESYEETLACV